MVHPGLKPGVTSVQTLLLNSLGHLFSEVMWTISRSKLEALSGHGATNTADTSFCVHARTNFPDKPSQPAHDRKKQPGPPPQYLSTGPYGPSTDNK